MGRMYTSPVNIAGATVTMDLFEVLAAAGKPYEVHGFEISQSTRQGDAQEQMVTLVLKRAAGAFTSGSGGGVSTPRPHLPNDTAAGATVETGNTTLAAVGTGTLVELARFGWNVRASALWVPTPEQRFVLAAAEALILTMAEAPAAAMDVVGWLTISELV